MKTMLTTGLVLLSLQASAQIKIQEELFVPGQKPEVVNELVKTGSVIVDHVDSEGFELYGQKGLSEYLDKKGILHFDMTEVKEKALLNYPSHAEITRKLEAAVAKLPGKMKLFSIGKSVRGKELWVVKISDNVEIDEVEPEFKYISSMHGDEITGRELTVMMIEEIAEKYGKDPEITNLVNNTEIFIMPSMNPDGSEMKRRANANGVDLNRNFPDWTVNAPNSAERVQIENKAVMNWQKERQFSLSANFHGGSVVVNYPWDATYARHPMDELLVSLSTEYAQLNPEMRSSREFEGGIVNGAQWYVVKGGMQDWSSFYHNDLQVTVELSETKWPSYSDIPGFWQSNRDSMYAYMKRVHQGGGFKFESRGVSGTVEVRQTSPASKNIGKFGFNNSEFYKVLPTGQYEFTVTNALNKSRQKISVSVDENKVLRNGNYQILK